MKKIKALQVYLKFVLTLIAIVWMSLDIYWSVLAMELRSPKFWVFFSASTILGLFLAYGVFNKNKKKKKYRL